MRPYSFFLEGIDAAGARLANFVNKAAHGDARRRRIRRRRRPGRGCSTSSCAAINAGAITETEALRADRTDGGRASRTLDRSI